MTAAIGHPTLRLIRVRIGNFRLGDLPAGNVENIITRPKSECVAGG